MELRNILQEKRLKMNSFYIFKDKIMDDKLQLVKRYQTTGNLTTLLGKYVVFLEDYRILSYPCMEL